MDRGAVTNHHSKQAAKKPNKPLKGRRACIAKAKKQTDNQDQSLTKSSKSTHLTPMHEGDTFRGPLENKSQDQLIGVDS
jgi:hypothetical protein